MRAIGAVGFLMAVVTGIASAAPVDIATAPVLAGPGDVRWTVTNTGGTDSGPTGTCGGQAGLTVQDARFDAEHGDAFDDGYTVWVDGAIFVAPSIVDVTDGTLTAGPVSMSGVDATVQYRAFTDSPTLRVLVTLANPGTTIATPSLKVLSNFGSNGDTTLVDQNGAVWLVEADAATDPVGDAVNTSIINGPANPLDVSAADPPYTVADDDTVFTCNGSQGRLLQTGSIVVPPGGAVRFLFFHQLHDRIDAASTAAHAFDAGLQRDDAVVADLGDAELVSAINWRFWPIIVLHGADVAWRFANNYGADDATITGSCSPSPGFAVDDAAFTTPDGHADAFDGGLELWVDGRQFVAPFGQTATDTSLRVGPTTLSNLAVSAQFDAATTAPRLRTLYSFANPTASAVTATIEITSNLGSDEGTGVRATSSGDATLDAADRWAVTSDDATAPGDAVDLHVFAGPGMPAVVPDSITTTTGECTSTDGVHPAFTLTVPAGATRSLLLFNEIHATNAEAIAAGPAYDVTPTTGDARLAGLPAAALADVVNWSLCAADVAVCDDGDACTADGCGAGGVGCAYAPLPRTATFVSADCRLRALIADVGAAIAAGKDHDALIGALDGARAAAADAETKTGTSRRKARRKAAARLKAFTKRLGRKSVRKTLTQAQRLGFAAAAKGVVQDLRALPK